MDNDKKFIESFDVADYEILTDTGWEDIECSHKTIEYVIWDVKTTSHILKCADIHILFDESYNEVYVNDLAIGDSIITESGVEVVESIEETSQEAHMYDLQLPMDTNHRYFTNGILSHNTTAYTVFCMHTCIFENDKKILICADSEEKAKEFLDRIKLAYENLPNWLKPSVLVWNKKKIKFGNGCTIMAVATSSNASRGYSANYCISGNSTIKIKIDGRTYKNKKTTDAYQMLEDKKTNCPCLELNDIDPAIEFCKMAVDIK